MDIQFLKRLLRLLFSLLVAGIGVALAALGQEWYRLAHPSVSIPFVALAILYIGSALVFGIIGFFLSASASDMTLNLGRKMAQYFGSIPIPQLMSAVLCTVLGLTIAALLSNIFRFMGESMFTTVLSAILYLVLGSLFYTIGYMRANEFQQYVRSFFSLPRRSFHRKTRHAARKGAQRGVPDKLLDASILIDGRLTDLVRTGFVEGDLIIPDFIVEELHHLQDSQDVSKRARGNRGLETITQLQNLTRARIRTMDEKSEDTLDTDVRLLRLAKDTDAVVMTGDLNLTKVAAVSEIRVMNINELASMLRPVVLPGSHLRATVVKEGREAGQGIAYMEDGTMIVVEDGRSHIGESLDLTVTTSLQTHAGRMVFAKLTESGETVSRAE